MNRQKMNVKGYNFSVLEKYISSPHAGNKPHYITHEGFVGIGALEVDNTAKLWKQDDVNKITAKCPQGVD